MNNYLSTALSLIQLMPRRSIGGITLDAIIEESHEDSLTITEHPVEQGAAISDHAYKKPEMVTIRGGVSDSGSLLGLIGAKRSTEVYAQLRALQAAREPIDIITGKRAYKNMLIETLSSSTDATTENSLLITIDCREVIIVKTQVTSVPPRENHADAKTTGGVSDKGAKQATPAGDAAKSSAGSSSLQSALGDEGGGYRRPGGAAPGYGA